MTIKKSWWMPNAILPLIITCRRALTCSAWRERTRMVCGEIRREPWRSVFFPLPGWRGGLIAYMPLLLLWFSILSFVSCDIRCACSMRFRLARWRNRRFRRLTIWNYSSLQTSPMSWWLRWASFLPRSKTWRAGETNAHCTRWWLPMLPAWCVWYSKYWNLERWKAAIWRFVYLMETSLLFCAVVRKPLYLCLARDASFFLLKVLPISSLVFSMPTSSTR